MTKLTAEELEQMFVDFVHSSGDLTKTAKRCGHSVAVVQKYSEVWNWETKMLELREKVNAQIESRLVDARVEQINALDSIIGDFIKAYKTNVTSPDKLLDLEAKKGFHDFIQRFAELIRLKNSISPSTEKVASNQPVQVNIKITAVFWAKQ